MIINPLQQNSSATSPEALGTGRKPTTPQEAAKQFEEILVRQFVKTMTDKLFTSGLSGENGPAWMDSYRDSERDVMTEELSRYLTESGSMNFSDLMLKKWGISPTPKSTDRAHLAAPQATSNNGESP